MPPRIIATLSKEDLENKVLSTTLEMSANTLGKVFMPFWGSFFAPKVKKIARHTNGFTLDDLLNGEIRFFTTEDVPSNYRFPITHPLNGSAYARSVEDEGFYIPVSNFHRYMLKSKMAAFNRLCANLGARRCVVVFAEENGKQVNLRVGAQDIPTQAGPTSGDGLFEGRFGSKTNALVDIEFTPPKSVPCKTDSIWMRDEPTWQVMEELRLSQGLKSFVAEFSYQDDMGINSNLAARLVTAGFDIGGTFESFSKVHWKFEVDFWPAD